MLDNLYSKIYGSNVLHSYRTVFNSNNESANRVLVDLLNISKYNESSVGKSVEETYFNEGAKHVIRHILQSSSRLSDSAIKDMETYLEKRLSLK